MPYHNTVGLHSQATRSALSLALLSYTTEILMPETPTLHPVLPLESHPSPLNPFFSMARPGTETFLGDGGAMGHLPHRLFTGAEGAAA